MSGSADTAMTSATRPAVHPQLQLLQHQIALCETLLKNWSLQTGDDEFQRRQLSLANARNQSDKLICCLAVTLTSDDGDSQESSGDHFSILEKSMTEMRLTEEDTAKITRSTDPLVAWAELNGTQTQARVREVLEGLRESPVQEKEKLLLSQDTYEVLKRFVPAEPDGMDAEAMAEGSIPFSLGCALVAHSYPFDRTSVRGG